MGLVLVAAHRAHFWGSAIGYIVPLVAISWFGEKLFEALREAPPTVWIAIVGTWQPCDRRTYGETELEPLG